MSQVATATVLASKSLPSVVKAAAPRRRWFGGSKDEYHAVKAEQGKTLPAFNGDGMYLVTALVWLEERGLDLLSSSHDADASTLTEARGATHIILEHAHRAHLPAMNSAVGSEDDLRQYYEAFHEVEDPPAGRELQTAMSYLRSLLDELKGDEIVLIEVG